MWLEGAFEVVVSPLLLDELGRILAYPKIRARVSETEAEAFVALLTAGASLVEDPGGASSPRTPASNDDYVVALAEASRAVIVSGDRHLLGLAGRLPVRSPGEFRRLVRMREGE